MHEALARKNFERDTAFLTEAYCDRLGWELHQCAFPVLDITVKAATPIRFRCSCLNWDEEPPSIAILKPDGQPWAENLPGGQFHNGPHDATGRPFICMRGVQEYHTHSSHLQEHWATYRGQDGMTLTGILTQLSHAWRRFKGA